MAKDGSVDVLIQKQAIENVAKANAALELTLKNILAINEASRKGGKGAGNNPNSADNINKANQASIQKLKLADQTIIMQKKLVQSEINLANALKKENAEIEKNRFELQRRKSLLKDEVKLNSTLTGAYEKLGLKLKKLRTDYKNVAVSEGTASKGAIRLRKEVERLDKQLKRVDASAGQFQRSVGNYPKQMGAAVRGLRSLASALGVVGGLFLAIRIAKDTFNRIREFDKSMRNIAGILGVTKTELKGLEQEIIKVAGASLKTSNEVAKLAQTLITLGKTKEEVIQLLDPVNQLSIGLESTSQEAGELLIQTLNAFGEGSSEAQRFADIIAKMRTSTALDFERIKDSLGFLAPVAKTAGLSFEEASAMLGVLVDNGIKASRAGRLLSTSLIKLATDGKTLSQGLDEINEAQSKNLTEIELLELSYKLFGKQSAAIGLILADNRDKTADLTKEFENADGTLKQLTNEQLKSLDAQLKILDSTFEKFILNVEKGDGALSTFFKGQIKEVINIINLFDRWNMSQEDLFDEAKLRGYNDQIKNAKDNYQLLVDGLDSGTKAPSFLEELNFDLSKSVDNTDSLITKREELKTLEDDIANNSARFFRNKLIAQKETLEASIKELSFEQGKRDAIIELIKLEKQLNPNGGGNGGDSTKKTVDFYNKVISKTKELRDSTATTSVEYKSFTKTITDAEAALKRLRGEYRKIIDISAGAPISGASPMTGGISAPTDLADTRGATPETPDRKALFDAQEAARDAELAFATDTAFQLVELGNTLFDRKISAIDAEIQAEEDKYATLFALAEGDENQQRLLAIEKEKSLQALEKKRREAQKKQAIFNKAQALADIAINTAVAVTKITAVAALAAPLLIPSIIALGAAQAATVLATPIPQFAKGGTMDHDGLAVVGDGGRKEVIKNPDGTIQVTPDSSTLVGLKKGAEIFPSIDSFSKDSDITDKIYSATVMASLSINNSQMKGYLETQKIFNDKLLDAMLDNTKAVKKSKSNVYVKNNKIDIPHELFKSKYTD